MRLAFVSNILNHHQVMLCDALREQFEQFTFIAVENIERIGYEKARKADYVLYYYIPGEKPKAEQEILEADVVIFGACPKELIALRMQYDKLSFLYSERFFKRGTWQRFLPATRKRIYDRVVKYKTNNMYVLCASAYLSYDLRLLGFPLKKCYKWGYFPEIEEQDIEKLIARKRENKRVSILWAGRLINWKHPEQAVYIAEKLKNAAHEFEMNIIGEGALESHLKQLAADKGLKDCIHFPGSLSPKEVRRNMGNADIFLFTSDQREGWGAVLNEAMNNGCAIVANHAAGAVPFLIQNGENGLIYANGNLDDLWQKVISLVEDTKQREHYARKAYQSTVDLWNGEIAAERFRHIVDILSDSSNIYEIYSEGPCSQAENLAD